LAGEAGPGYATEKRRQLKLSRMNDGEETITCFHF
jgi:hypothetical protein